MTYASKFGKAVTNLHRPQNSIVLEMTKHKIDFNGFWTQRKVGLYAARHFTGVPTMLISTLYFINTKLTKYILCISLGKLHFYLIYPLIGKCIIVDYRRYFNVVVSLPFNNVRNIGFIYHYIILKSQISLTRLA